MKWASRVQMATLDTPVPRGYLTQAPQESLEPSALKARRELLEHQGPREVAELKVLKELPALRALKELLERRGRKVLRASLAHRGLLVRLDPQERRVRRELKEGLEPRGRPDQQDTPGAMA